MQAFRWLWSFGWLLVGSWLALALKLFGGSFFKAISAGGEASNLRTDHWILCTEKYSSASNQNPTRRPPKPQSQWPKASANGSL